MYQRAPLDPIGGLGSYEKPAQPTEPRYIRDCRRPGDDGGEQAQQRDLIEGILDLAALSSIRQISEMIQEDDRFIKRPGLRRSIAILRLPNQWNMTDSALDRFLTNVFTQSFWNFQRSG